MQSINLSSAANGPTSIDRLPVPPMRKCCRWATFTTQRSFWIRLRIHMSCVGRGQSLNGRLYSRGWRLLAHSSPLSDYLYRKGQPTRRSIRSSMRSLRKQEARSDPKYHRYMIHIRLISVLTKHQKLTTVIHRKIIRPLHDLYINQTLNHAKVHHTYLLTL